MPDSVQALDAEPSRRSADHRFRSASPTGTQWRANLPLLIAGAIAVVGGGMAAAVTGPTDWDDGSWVAAFLVLVTGVAQIAVAAAQAELSPTVTSARFIVVEGMLWNTSCIAIIAGTLLSAPVIVSIGGTSLMIALGMSVVLVRGSVGGPRLLLWSYRVLLVVLMASIPIGLTLAWMRH